MAAVTQPWRRTHVAPEQSCAEEFTHTRFERRDHVVTITLDRPERRNALNYRAYDELEAAFRAASSDLTFVASS